ncbi:MarR family transcriptional regulator [Nguyenibacter vanlangensis]|uniref:MarR family transcriptional regulator n=1 Tax=Nguyenibacter vanlangensis TaxID=1216886 RepID=A0A7Y7M662_9PROT|nr:MarR family transcriptional regulator [Nguyenibacter vanlangensis]
MTRPRKTPFLPEFRLEDSPFYWMGRISSMHGLKAERALKRAGVDNSQWKVLSALSQRDMSSLSQLMDAAILKQSTLTKVIQRMAADGLVHVATSQDDGRAIHITITDQGRATLERLRPEIARIFSFVFDDLSDSEMDALNARLRMIFEQLQRF